MTDTVESLNEEVDVNSDLSLVERHYLFKPYGTPLNFLLRGKTFNDFGEHTPTEGVVARYVTTAQNGTIILI